MTNRLLSQVGIALSVFVLCGSGCSDRPAANDQTATIPLSSEEVDMSGHFSDGTKTEPKAENSQTDVSKSIKKVNTESGIVEKKETDISVSKKTTVVKEDSPSVTTPEKPVVVPNTSASPVCTISASPSEITDGDTVSLTWKTSDSESIYREGTISGFDGEIQTKIRVFGAQGSINVHPKYSGFFTASLNGSNGTVSCSSARVEVKPKPAWYAIYSYGTDLSFASRPDTEVKSETIKVIGKQLRITYSCSPYRVANSWFSGVIDNAVGLPADNLSNGGVFANRIPCPVDKTSVVFSNVTPGDYRFDFISNYSFYVVKVEEYW